MGTPCDDQLDLDRILTMAQVPVPPASPLRSRGPILTPTHAPTPADQTLDCKATSSGVPVQASSPGVAADPPSRPLGTSPTPPREACAVKAGRQVSGVSSPGRPRRRYKEEPPQGGPLEALPRFVQRLVQSAWKRGYPQHITEARSKRLASLSKSDFFEAGRMEGMGTPPEEVLSFLLRCPGQEGRKSPGRKSPREGQEGRKSPRGRERLSPRPSLRTPRPTSSPTFPRRRPSPRPNSPRPVPSPRPSPQVKSRRARSPRPCPGMNSLLRDITGCKSWDGAADNAQPPLQLKDREGPSVDKRTDPVQPAAGNSEGGYDVGRSAELRALLKIRSVKTAGWAIAAR
eukprot:Hpha_TRINITY_DN11879_c0_g1::TRINITY_DN11879_c0_g1_i1::g.2043::m.2043